MPVYNITNSLTPEENYQSGLLPQRNRRGFYYADSSCRSSLADFRLSSENRRILNRTADYKFTFIPLVDFDYSPQRQKNIGRWIRLLDWDFPLSSLRTVFTDHLFNRLYLWHDSGGQEIAYALCYFSDNISHVAYVFYSPELTHSNLPIRLVLQVVIDSRNLGLDYCYLGRFSQKIGYYKRNMPGFQYFDNGQWVTYTKNNED